MVRIVAIIALLAVTPLAVVYGLKLRREVWTQTQSIRFMSDVSNAFSRGQEADEHGIFYLYDDLVREEGDNGEYGGLDYPPLRLTVAHTWYLWTQEKYPGLRHWENNYELTEPMLRLNLAAELSASVLVCVLIWVWGMRKGALSVAARLNMIGAGIVGGLIFWFNPALIWDSHAFPQWDVWLIPFFLAGVLLASFEWWFAAGVAVVIAVFLKGQILLVAPIFVFWPIFEGKWRAALGFSAGFALVGAMIVIPWMHPQHAATAWLIRCGCAIVLLTAVSFIPQIKWRWIPSITVAALMLAWPFQSAADLSQRCWIIPIFGVLALARFVPVTARLWLAALAAGACVFMLPMLFGDSSAWLTVGFEYGSRKFQNVSDDGDYNIPHLLEVLYDWSMDVNYPVAVSFWKNPISFKNLMLGAYAVFLLASSAGAAIQARRRDARFLAAIIAPWICFPLLLTQMNCRYLIWGASLIALSPAVDWGAALLGILLSLICWAQIEERMLLDYPFHDRMLLRNLQRCDPHLGWMVILIAGVCLYLGLAPRGKFVKPRTRIRAGDQNLSRAGNE